MIREGREANFADEEERLSRLPSNVLVQQVVTAAQVQQTTMGMPVQQVVVRTPVQQTAMI